MSGTITVRFVDYDGVEHRVETSTGGSMMAAAMLTNVPGIIAECGGSCSCATCHVYLDEEWLARVAPPASEETDLLEFVEGMQSNSRLSCQLLLTEDLDGILVRTPPPAS